MTRTLKYNADGQFKIVQFTDLHWGDDEANNRLARVLMDQVLAEERPDLVVVTGDVIEEGSCTNPRESMRQAVEAMEESGTPWALVFGNHDAEAAITREDLMPYLEEVRYGLTQRGPKTITGVGNYVLQVEGRNGETDLALFFIDSGDYYADPKVGGYATIARNQIDWFARESEALAAANGGTPVPALAFFHIPLPEYAEVWKTQVCYGTKSEPVCCARLNSGMFAAMVEAGNVIGTFAGHDHSNDYWGELHGISLCYGRKTGYNNYMIPGMLKGARIITIEEGKRGFRSWLRLENGETVMEQPEHQPEG